MNLNECQIYAGSLVSVTDICNPTASKHTSLQVKNIFGILSFRLNVACKELASLVDFSDSSTAS